MRIAMFMPGLGPDALGWKVHLDFAAAVERRGHRFELLTTPLPGRVAIATRIGGRADEEKGTGAGSAVATVLPEPAACQRLVPLGRPLLRTRQLLPAAGALAHHLRADGDSIDLLHAEVAYPHGAATALAAAWARWRGPIGLTPMGEDVLVVDDASYGVRRYLLPRALVTWTLRRAACLRCISPMFAERIAALSPNNPRRVIPLGISDETAAAAEMTDDERAGFRRASREALDAEFDTAGRPVVLSFGRLHPFKGIDVLVDASARIPDAMVLVVGPPLSVRPFGDVAAMLRARAARAGVADRVRLVGAVHPSRALEVLAASDVVVVPSYRESLNKVCMEAAAVGTPFVVTETTGIAAWVRDDGVGLVVPPRNPAVLAWAIDEVISGHWRIDPVATRNFALQFTPDLIAEQVCSFYEEVLAARG